MNVVDLFAGCGGMSLGFQNAGFDIKAAFDKWKPAIEVYQANFAHPIIEMNLAEANSLEIFTRYSPEMIIGGPPCQDFSSAGKRDESLGRADLTLKFADIIKEVRPNWFVMENVERITKSEILQNSISVYRSAGYGLTAKTLNASFYNVPQSRKRFFLIGNLQSSDGFLDEYLEQKQADSPMSVFDYLGNDLGTEYYYRHPRTYQRRGIFSVYEPSPTVRGVNRPIPETYKKHSGDACEPNGKVRPLTTKERSFIQTFPKDFNLIGTKTNLEQMVGNAVPVKLAEFVANCIKNYIKDKKDNKIKKSKQMTLQF